MSSRIYSILQTQPLVKTQDGIILHNDKLLYADLINKKIKEIVVPEKKQSQVEKLKKSILNMEEVQKNANDKELALIILITGRDSKKTTIGRTAYTFCVLDKLQSALKRRDVFISPSWRYADPRANLYSGSEWEAVRPMICRSLNLTIDPAPTITNLSDELHQVYRLVAANMGFTAYPAQTGNEIAKRL